MSSTGKTVFIRVIICLEIFLLISSTMGDYRDFRDNGKKRFCGRMLTDSLALLCNGEYEAIIHPSKRSDELLDDITYADQPIEDLPIQYQAMPFLAKLAPELASEMALRPPRVRREWVARRGVYDECCRNPCSFSTLNSYCKRKTPV